MVTRFERKRAFYKLMRDQVQRFKELHRLFWKANNFLVHSPTLSSAWKASFERHRLKLPILPSARFGLEAIDRVTVPGLKESDFDEDANLQDLLFLLQLSQARDAKRLLEVGTYRAKTTYALHLNVPEAYIRSYDVRAVDSPYRQLLLTKPNIALKLGSFSEDGDALRKEAPYDFIFIDGSHRLEDVLSDSQIAFDIVSPGGVVIWHDYRRSGYFSPDLQVPEALHHLAKQFPISWVKDTNCAIYLRE